MGLGRSFAEMTMAVLIIIVVIGATVMVLLVETRGSRGRGVWIKVVTTFFRVAEGWASFVDLFLGLLPCLVTIIDNPSMGIV